MGQTFMYPVTMTTHNTATHRPELNNKLHRSGDKQFIYHQALLIVFHMKYQVDKFLFALKLVIEAKMTRLSTRSSQIHHQSTNNGSNKPIRGLVLRQSYSLVQLELIDFNQWNVWNTLLLCLSARDPYFSYGDLVLLAFRKNRSYLKQQSLSRCSKVKVTMNQLI